jgi:hypothetical protein
MKVYCVYWSDGETDMLDKIFASEEKAREYTQDNTFRTPFHRWIVCEAEVIQ